ncbi:MAG: flavohemoglobin expression-modulating QEGLA motif protein, partial [Lautropia sp.]
MNADHVAADSLAGHQMLSRVLPALSGHRPFRVISAGGDRVHVDRDLPFMCTWLRGTVEPPSLARRVAASSAIHMLWSRQRPDDTEPEQIVNAIARHMRLHYDGFLLIEIRDQHSDPTLDSDSPQLRDFRFDVEAANLTPPTDVLNSLAAALERNEIDYRNPTVHLRRPDDGEPPLQELGPLDPAIARLSISLPAIHRSPDGERQYPALFHQMEAAVIDAVLRTAMDFARHNKTIGSMHHRALGRRAFVQAARTVDRQLTEISGSYDFLLDLTPINSAQALDDFLRGDCVISPQFRYRPLAIAPGELKRALYSINIGRIEDPSLEDLFREKQLEMDHQLTMLQCRNTANFRAASRLLYGGVDDELLAMARAVLEDARQRAQASAADPADETVDCDQILAAARRTIAFYQGLCPTFRATAVLRDDLPPGLMVSGSRLLISRQTRMSAQRLPALLQHEVGVHLLTYFNGDAQGLRIFRSGLAGYEKTQEGLAVFAEFATGGTGPQRLLLIAARVLAVHAMLDGANFIETFRMLKREAGMADAEAFGVALRVHRSGGLSKDSIYLQGLEQVLKHVSGGGDLEPFWFGKIAAHHFNVLQELRARGMLHGPALRPAFLSSPQGRRFVEATASGLGLRDLLSHRDSS